MITFLSNTWHGVVEIALAASVFVLAGFVVAGVLHAFVSSERLQRFLGTGRFWPVLKAALVGLPLPLCSCGVLPVAIGLRRQGSTNGATVSFLISTPETSVDSIVISFALLDPVMTIFRPVAAFITALVTGVACDALTGEKREREATAREHACCAVRGSGPGARTFGARLRHGMRFAFVDMLDDLGKWLVVGVVLAGVITALVPAGFLEQYGGGGLPAMLVMLVVGIPLYMCSVASTPLAAALIVAGISPGAALVLLLVGPATNAAGITVLAKALGARVTIVYVAGVAVVSVLMGLLLDVVYGFIVPISPQEAIGRTAEILPEWLRAAGAIVLAAALLWALVRRLARTSGSKVAGGGREDGEHDHGLSDHTP
ncbi:MAG: permease [Planctomycetota bacterium]|nr:MAG: permease [Planctomycetota bacterium]